MNPYIKTLQENNFIFQIIQIFRINFSYIVKDDYIVDLSSSITLISLLEIDTCTRHTGVQKVKFRILIYKQNI